MTVSNVNSAIEKLEAINPNEEYAYEKAILAYLTIKKLPVLLYDIPAETIIFGQELTKPMIFSKPLATYQSHPSNL